MAKWALTSTVLENLLNACSDLFAETERFALPDKVISAAISKFSGNDSLESVLPKTIIINSFYATQIYDTTTMAKHIVNLSADERLNAGDITLVDDIRHGHAIAAFCPPAPEAIQPITNLTGVMTGLT